MALLVIVLALVIACCLGVLASNAGRILDSHGWAPAGAADAGQGWQEGAVPSGTPTASRVVPGY